MTLNIEEKLKRLDVIAAIGSPSTTGELTLDILEPAAASKLVGEMSFFQYEQDGLSHYALGQITSVELRNRMLEESTMRALARQKGSVYPVSGFQDTHIGKMNISAVFCHDGRGFQPSILGTVPPTGTRIMRLDDELIDAMIESYRHDVFFLGRAYGSKPLIPFWFKHFGTGHNGAGEAYHLGIFGKTGSGKSVLAKMILVAYAQHRDMAIVILDPQGEFTADFSGRPSGGFRLDLKAVMEKSLGRKVHAFGVRNLVLDRWDLFEEILFNSLFFERLTIPAGENRRIACEVLSEQLQKKRKVKLADLATPGAFQAAWSVLQEDAVLKQIYKTQESRSRFAERLAKADRNEFYRDYWLPVARLFEEGRPGSRKVESILYSAFEEGASRPVVVIDLSDESAGDVYWNDKVQALVVNRLLQGIELAARQRYREGRSLNTLVMLDEAHRFAPRERIEDEHLSRVRATLLDAVRTTRKYGLGWMFISQTLSSLHREIINQLRIMFIGYGLSLGMELLALKEIIGGDESSLSLYRSFRDPHSAFDSSSREYSFMSVGPVSPFSFSGTPLFITAFNSPEHFLDANSIVREVGLF